MIPTPALYYVLYHSSFNIVPCSMYNSGLQENDNSTISINHFIWTKDIWAFLKEKENRTRLLLVNKARVLSIVYAQIEH